VRIGDDYRIFHVFSCCDGNLFTRLAAEKSVKKDNVKNTYNGILNILPALLSARTSAREGIQKRGWRRTTAASLVCVVVACDATALPMKKRLHFPH
uniref:Uncharacterized protein n=1 Tax=Aquila chrysaetos chrysaetos TaxID=223781 RepID=A0A663F4T2_AQUCH